jgi:membrane-anchored protein YejM (alkaline phosphatase superfamily)
MIDYENTFKKRLKILLKFLSINYIFTLLIEIQYIFTTPGVNSLHSRIFAYSALFSNTLMIYLVLLLVLIPFIIFKTRKIFYLIVVPLTILLQLLAVTDVAIYKIFKFHINSVVINFFTTEGSWDSIYLGLGTTITIALIIILFIIAEFILMKKLFIKKQLHYTKRKSKKLRYIILFLLMAVIIDKFYFAYSDLYNDTQVTRLKKLYPLYQPLTVKRTMEKLFGFNVDKTYDIKIDKSGNILKYPLKPIVLPEKPNKPNIIWIVLDAFRYDMLNKEVTPAITKLSEKSQLFLNHLSGGNSTRFGVFSMYYGIYSYNWHQFLGERLSPVLMNNLIKLGYNFSINSSTRLTYPEFRKTAFIKIPNSIKDKFPGENSYERDRNQTDYVVNWLKKYDSDKPFFSFVFLDSSHSRVYPPEFEKFKTDTKTTNYLFLTEKSISTSKLNYMNSLWYEDHLVKEIIDTLKAKDMLKNTIILITGDHGEEFHEHGFFGHNSAFTPEQIHVPLVLYIPDKEPKKYEKMTSHLDLPATFFDIIGIKADPDTYSNGMSMFGAKERTYTVSCNWNNCSYVDDENTIVFSMESFNAGLFEVRDKNYKEVKHPKEVLKKKMKNIMQVMKDFSRFNQ